MMKKFVLYILCFSAVNTAIGQTLLGQDDENRVISSAVPFLMISPDARASGMGDVGVATSPDAYSVFWNPAKVVYMDNSDGLAMSYTPWLSKIVNDMFITYLSGYHKITKEQAVTLGLRYFDLGDFNFTDAQGNNIGEFAPREFSLDAGYSRMLTEKLSIGIVIKYIRSNLTGNFSAGGNDARPGSTAASDVGIYYRTDLTAGGKQSQLALGAHISNIGGKITYSDEFSKEFLPANLRLGGTYTMELDPLNRMSFSLDLNKLLVPTPPIRDDNGQIIRGKDPNRSMLSGVFGSFSDAPDGFNEEIKEFTLSVGTEYWFNNSFAGRAGYFTESDMKGGRKYFSLGLGFRYQVFGIDFAYMMPKREHPLAETLRFTLVFNFENATEEDSVVED